ncbi:lysin [Lactobacillus phage Satyr]|uniref:Lysin n=1 Tax=Lactobacillus phage Satyr TaxID=2070201 RepID=A0A2K9V574_9CAUD|nr:transglycosylase [Lactobacillus phage Satyr]AUV57316.1 lysin [Lactobacillus phage Satyr]
MKKALVASSMVLGLAFGVQVANADTYTVQAGDTVSKIAYQHGTTVNDIVAQNQLSNPNLIYVGDKLEISAPAVNYQTYTQAPVKEQAQTPVEQPKATQVQQQQTQPVQSAQRQVQKPQVQQPQEQQQVQQPQSNQSSVMSKTSGQLSQAEINQVAQEMSSRTGESSATWSMIINRESRGNVNISNSQGSGAFGLFQNMHISSGNVGTQVDKAVQLYHAQGIQAWQQTAY